MRFFLFYITLLLSPSIVNACAADNEEIFAFFDSDKNGYITWDEYSDTGFTHKIFSVFSSNIDEKMRSEFNDADINKDGKITLDEVRDPDRKTTGSLRAAYYQRKGH